MLKTALHSVSYAGVWPGQASFSLEEFLCRAKQLGFGAVMLMAKRPHLSSLTMTRRHASVCVGTLTDGHVAYEMCSPLRGSGREDNRDRCARWFLDYMAQF